ncbi:SIR2 family protein [Rhizobium leguminosarum]|uniref:SIR2 family protein n=1 Tax=Rhizobium leguminosarum TaxID=384 RepID=UPI0010319A0F|nr:SIR2 family protein [Rhizobium leguminosarum]TBF80814.1 hypothetical protein ELG86_01025 [Rhizobium leguminosarum]
MGIESAYGDWCRSDRHSIYERFPTFNKWLDEKGEDAERWLDDVGLLKLGVPSKALFAGDYPAYRVALERYMDERRFQALGGSYFDNFWLSHNRSNYERLLDAIRARVAIPFVGAGASMNAGYSAWASHLLDQARLAGIPNAEARIAKGEFEEIVDEIMNDNKPVFIASIRRDFLKPPTSLDFHAALLKLFQNVVVTTNYDPCLELTYRQLDVSFSHLFAKEPDNQALIAATTNRRSMLLKIHGDIEAPSTCVLTKTQYEEAYGKYSIDFSLPIPRKLRRVYETMSLVFVGCSLLKDRTLEVFAKVMEERGPSDLPSHFAFVEAPPTEEGLVERNKFLLALGISPIFYPPGEHRFVREMIDMLTVEEGG